MTKQEAIAQFLNNHCTLLRMSFPYSMQSYPRNRGLVYGYPHQPQGATIESLAEEFLAMPEFLALRLGGFLGTPQGHVIAEGVRLVTPPFYEPDVELLIGGLTYAAELQAKGDQKAGLVALGVIGGVALLAAGLGPRSAKAA